MSVDLETAQAVAAASTHEDSAYWIACIDEGRADGRLEHGFSCRNGTLFSSDIVPMSSLPEEREEDLGPPPGRLVDLLDQGLSEHQANGVMVAEVAFIAITVSGVRGASTVAPHVGAVIFSTHGSSRPCASTARPPSTPVTGRRSRSARSSPSDRDATSWLDWLLPEVRSAEAGLWSVADGCRRDALESNVCSNAGAMRCRPWTMSAASSSRCPGSARHRTTPIGSTRSGRSRS